MTTPPAVPAQPDNGTPPVPNQILLFEATDAVTTTYANLVARNASSIYLDSTVNSYPAPFTLLN
jgi:hypothetical protein